MELRPILAARVLIVLICVTLCGCAASPIVERVSGCHEPRLVKVLHNVLMRCTPESFVDDDHAGEECFTQPVAGGPGMRGILPSSCSYVNGAMPSLGSLPANAPVDAVAALRNYRGRVVGTGFLIAPRVLLTAGHVVTKFREAYEQGYRAYEQLAPVVAVFGSVLSEEGVLPSISRECSVRLDLEWDENSLAKVKTLILKRNLRNMDYALIELNSQPEMVAAGISPSPRSDLSLSASDGTVLALPADSAGAVCRIASVSPAPPGREAIIGESANLLGHTASPFYPRGLVWSGGGRFVVPPQSEDSSNVLAYNIQTTPGFSGAPVFDASFNWVGIHTNGDDSLGAAKHYIPRKERPNTGKNAHAILGDIACSLDDSEQKRLELWHLLAPYRGTKCL